MKDPECAAETISGKGTACVVDCSMSFRRERNSITQTSWTSAHQVSAFAALWGYGAAQSESSTPTSCHSGHMLGVGLLCGWRRGKLEATTWPSIRYPVRLPNLTAFWRQIIPHSLKEPVIWLPPWVKHVRCQEMQLVLYKEEEKNGNVTFEEDCVQLCTRLWPCAVGWLWHSFHVLPLLAYCSLVSFFVKLFFMLFCSCCIFVVGSRLHQLFWKYPVFTSYGVEHVSSYLQIYCARHSPN